METIQELRGDFPEIKIIAIYGGGRMRPDPLLLVARRLGADGVSGTPGPMHSASSAATRLMLFVSRMAKMEIRRVRTVRTQESSRDFRKRQGGETRLIDASDASRPLSEAAGEAAARRVSTRCRLRRRLRAFGFGHHETVTYAGLGEQVPRLGRFGLDLLPDMPHVTTVRLKVE